MALVRMLVSWGLTSSEVKDWKSNTLYFNVSGSIDDPDYQGLANDLAAVYDNQTFTSGQRIEVRAYNMADATPRIERAFAFKNPSGAMPQGPAQVALCLSYYADRNLPRRRGRIYTGPWTTTTPQPDSAYLGQLIQMGQDLAALGGLNVDWSVYSPTTPANYRISNIWVDDSWDIVRSRKLDATTRVTATING